MNLSKTFVDKTDNEDVHAEWDDIFDDLLLSDMLYSSTYYSVTGRTRAANREPSLTTTTASVNVYVTSASLEDVELSGGQLVAGDLIGLIEPFALTPAQDDYIDIADTNKPQYDGQYNVVFIRPTRFRKRNWYKLGLRRK
jgi:hypothetical protein